MKVKLIAYTLNPEETCKKAALWIFGKPEEDVNTKKADKLLKKILDSKHLSVIEHASFTFYIEGISRACSHQLVRHRIASYTQESQRYKKMSQEYVIPPTIKNNAEALKKFEECVKKCFDIYEELLSLGINKEDARYVLPNACKTRIIVTMNARELYHFFSLRCCNRAQWEIRELAYKMLEEIRKVAPKLFEKAGPSCEFYGYCPEGELSCGKINEIKKDKK